MPFCFASPLSLGTIHGFHSPSRSNPPLAAGELSYESDAAERLRSELRAMQVLAGTVLMSCQLWMPYLPSVGVLLRSTHVLPASF